MSVNGLTLRMGCLAAFLCLAAFPAFAETTPGEDDASSRREVRITYITGSSVYVDAGRNQGLREGDRLEVVRGDEVVGVLTLTFLSTNKASCIGISSPRTSC